MFITKLFFIHVAYLLFCNDSNNLRRSCRSVGRLNHILVATRTRDTKYISGLHLYIRSYMFEKHPPHKRMLPRLLILLYLSGHNSINSWALRHPKILSIILKNKTNWKGEIWKICWAVPCFITCEILYAGLYKFKICI